MNFVAVQNTSPLLRCLHKCVFPQSKHKSSDNQRTTQASAAMTTPLPMVVLHAERLDFQVTSAMYCRSVVATVSRLIAPSGNLLHHCHSHMYIKVLSKFPSRCVSEIRDLLGLG